MPAHVKDETLGTRGPERKRDAQARANGRSPARRVASRTTSSSTPWISARRAPTTGTHAGRLRLPRLRHRARGRGCRSRRASARAGTSAAAARTSGAPLNVTMPEKLRYGAAVEARAGFVGAAGEAVEDGARRHALGVEDVERVVPRLAGVDHERQVELVGERDLGGERRPAGRRAASGRSGSRARTRRRRPAAPAPSKRSRIVSTPWRASWGCSPTVACTPGKRAATASASIDDARSHPTVTIVATPAAAASATSSAAASAGRWQWESSQPVTSAGRQAVIRGNSDGPLVTGRPPG